MNEIRYDIVLLDEVLTKHTPRWSGPTFSGIAKIAQAPTCCSYDGVIQTLHFCIEVLPTAVHGTIILSKRLFSHNNFGNSLGLPTEGMIIIIFCFVVD